jgi:polar amino acid transport system substrate-binding protein
LIPDLNIVSTVSGLARKIKSLPLGRVIFGLAVWSASALPVPAQPVPIPNFWDPRARPERPDLTGLRPIRFLVDDEFPPLNFAGPDGTPTGFAVELARALCESLTVSCTVQTRRFDTLLEALQAGSGDVIAAGIPISVDLRRRFSVTSPYFKIPARFVARKDRQVPDPQGKALRGRTIAVVSGSAHEAFAKAFFPAATLKIYPDLPSVQAAVKGAEVDYGFANGVSLALWIGGTGAAECCAFVGGPYLESRFFGEGIGLIMRPEDETLRRALEFALQRLWDEGKFAELYLRFFPISPY